MADRKTAPYLLALAVCAAGLLLRLPVWTVLGSEAPFITFYPAVVLAAFRGGLRSGLAATLLSCLLVWFLIIPPQFSFLGLAASGAMAILYFVILGATISLVSERMHQARQEADTQRQVTYSTLASIGDAVIATDRQARVAFVNPVAEQLTGWTGAQATGRPLREIFDLRNEDTGNEVEDPTARVLREGVIVGLANHTVLKARDGRTIPIEDSAAPIRNHQGTIIGAVLVFRDVTKNREAEKRLAATERRLSQLARANVIGVLFGDIYGNIRDANNELLRMIGYAREDLERGLRWRDITPDEYLAADDKALAEARETGACTPYEKEYVRVDGKRVPIMIGYVLLEPDRIESVAFIVDLTERKKAFEDLQTFTYGASHDLKEPLRMIASYSQLLQRKLGAQADEDVQEYLRYISGGIGRMRALIDSLLEYSRAGEIVNVQTPVPAAEALTESLVALSAAIHESSAEVTHGPLPAVMIEPLLLTSLFQNVIGNAIQYGARRVQISSTPGPDGCHTFCVKDDGPGIPAEHHERIFGAFQRLHGREKPGSGLGLATCRRIVERHGGRMWVESDGRDGSVFCFTLPERSYTADSGKKS